MSTQPKLLDRVRDRLRYKQYSLRTEQAYIHWIKRFIYFHNKRHPEQMNGPEVEAFLTHLAKNEKVAAATQDQALSALLFLYKEIIQKELPWLDGIERPKRPARLPVVLTEGEVRALLARLEGTHWLLARPALRGGLRLRESTHLLAVGYNRRTGQKLLGHSDVSTTMIYTHVLNKGGRGVTSPLD